ncbi:MAG: SDR family oxidoreductase [Halococcoides sp.]
MDVLVLGAEGLLGSNVVRAADRRDWSVSGTYYAERPPFDCSLTELDVRETTALADVLDDRDPDAVVNCTAMTDVDGCEAAPEQAQAINGAAPGAMTRCCTDRDVEFCHVSTDYVFDGRDRGRYREDDPVDPIQVYGASKLAGERAVRESAEAPIVRLSFVWGVHRARGELAGFPAWVCDRLGAGESVPLFTDQWVTPTRAGQAAATILELLDAGATGTYHVAASDCVTPSAFGRSIADRVGADPGLCEEGSTADVDRPAERPTHTCLAVDRIEATLDRAQPTLDADLAAVEDALYEAC